MPDEFLGTWFSGLSESLETMDTAHRSEFLRPCARACSDSYPRNVFVEAREESNGVEDFLRRVEAKMRALRVERNEDGTVVFVYPAPCLCVLVTEGYVRTPTLCECSRLSLTYNLEVFAGEGGVEVTLLQSVLGGADSCRLLVRFAEA